MTVGSIKLVVSIDLNPVRADMVTAAEDYNWSSYRDHITLSNNRWLDQSKVFQELGSTSAARAIAYRTLVSEESKNAELTVIRAALKRNQITGTELLRKKIAKRTGRRISSLGPGRPRTDK
jgi:REP-associated tyrosine transposase